MYLISSFFGLIMKELIKLYQDMGLITKDLILSDPQVNYTCTDVDGIMAWSRVFFFVMLGIIVIGGFIALEIAHKEQEEKREKWNV